MICGNYDLVIELPPHPSTAVQIDWLNGWMHAQLHGRDPALDPLRVFVHGGPKRRFPSPSGTIVSFEHEDVPHPHKVRYASRKSFPIEVRCMACGMLGVWVVQADDSQPKEWTSDGIHTPMYPALDLEQSWYVANSAVRWYGSA